MNKAYAIDTSIFVRLLTGHPAQTATEVLNKLLDLQKKGVELMVCSMVIGEAYMAIQHHYGLEKKVVRMAMLDVLTSGLLTPMDGPEVLEILASTKGAGLLDHLIALQGEKAQMMTLTLDRKMASHSNCQKL